MGAKQDSTREDHRNEREQKRRTQKGQHGAPREAPRLTQNCGTTSCLKQTPGPWSPIQHPGPTLEPNTGAGRPIRNQHPLPPEYRTVWEVVAFSNYVTIKHNHHGCSILSHAAKNGAPPHSNYGQRVGPGTQSRPDRNRQTRHSMITDRQMGRTTKLGHNQIGRGTGHPPTAIQYCPS